jgi:hypothetical protein
VLKINLKQINKDSKNFKIESGNSYIETYKTFVGYFENLKVIKKENFIIGTHFVYGWMPTILNLNLKNEKEILSILNKVKNSKKDEYITIAELEKLKLSVNNSVVGTSKLLHFISPNKYVIWDKRVYRYIFGKENSYQVQKTERYLEYVESINEIVKGDFFKKIYKRLDVVCGYKITPIRLVELIMFETDKRNTSAD